MNNQMQILPKYRVGKILRNSGLITTAGQIKYMSKSRVNELLESVDSNIRCQVNNRKIKNN